MTPKRRHNTPASSPFTIKFIWFFLVWWLLSAQTSFFHLLAGMLVCALLARSVVPLGWLVPSAWLGWLWYIPWLLTRIVKANLHVARLVLTPRPRLSPKMVRYTADLSSDAACVILSQSITLTPGTITATLETSTQTLHVHALDESSAEDLVSHRLEELVGRLTRSRRAGS